MAGKTLDIYNLIQPDHIGIRIAEQWSTWKIARAEREKEWEEIRRYVYATDTTETSNATLPWKNKTTIPKLCQIADNLYANYVAAMFPKRKWLVWESDTESGADKNKVDAIEMYMMWAVQRSDFKNILQHALLDYIMYGQPLLTAEWLDERRLSATGEKLGYVGPVPVRINPLDMVMNPLAPSFSQAPKIIRSYKSLGEIKDIIDSETRDDNLEEMKDLYTYLLEVRRNAFQHDGDIAIKDGFFQMDGFTDFRSYLGSDYVEILTFYGDMYDHEKGVLLKNHIITIADRHKVLSSKQNPALFGAAQIFSSSWRKRQDNLWGMGPLDNLLGMQYRIDHLENMKADVFDIIAFPPLKIKGYVEDFEWAPMSRIYVGDDGDVNMLVPDVNALNANFEIDNLEKKMEEMAGAPKEAMGFRTPGEKTAFEVKSLENSASRVFQNKIAQFEEEVVEPLLNAMLELATRKMDGTTPIRVFDDESKIVRFNELSVADITGQGRIRPMAARHFAERADTVQSLTSFFSSAVGQDPDVRRHFSSIKLANMAEDLLDLDRYNLVSPNIRLIENAEAQTLNNVSQEQSAIATGTPSGLTPEDTTNSFMP